MKWDTWLVTWETWHVTRTRGMDTWGDGGDRLSSFANLLSSVNMSKNLRERGDQFDIRLNIEDEEHLELLKKKVTTLYDEGNVKYIHLSGVEMGDIPGRTSFGKKHVHIALCLFNYTSIASILRKFTYYEKEEGWKRVIKAGYYIACRDKSKPIQGWINYHSKQRTKIDPTEGLVVQLGTVPKCKAFTKQLIVDKGSVKAQEWARRRQLMVLDDFETLDKEFPGFQYTSAGRHMRSDVLKQSNTGAETLVGPLENYIIYGPSGTGKSSSIAYLWPNCYKKQKGSQYWDGYDKSNPDHSVVWIDEMSVETLRCLTGKIDGGFEFLKELGDRYPVTVDEKYTKGYKIRPKQIIITMNEHPNTLLPDRAVQVNKMALHRKFKCLYVTDWLNMHGLVCTNKGVVEDPDFLKNMEFNLNT